MVRLEIMGVKKEKIRFIVGVLQDPIYF